MTNEKSELGVGDLGVDKRLSRVSVFLIAAAVLQRGYEVTRDSAIEHWIGTIVVVVPLMMAVVVGLHVWRGRLLAHALALGALAGSGVRSSVRLVSGDKMGLEFSNSYEISDFVLLAVVWLVVVILLALRKRGANVSATKV
jgi:hypothetical protein